MEHATYLRQLFPTLTLFGVMVFSGASCTETSKTGVVQENNRKSSSRPLSKIDGKNGKEKSDKDQKEEGGSGRPQASTPNPPVASSPVVEPNNPAEVALSQEDCAVNCLLDALDSEEFKKEVGPDAEGLKTLITECIVSGSNRRIKNCNIAELLKSGKTPIQCCHQILKSLEEAVGTPKVEEENNKNATKLKRD